MSAVTVLATVLALVGLAALAGPGPGPGGPAESVAAGGGRRRPWQSAPVMMELSPRNQRDGMQVD